MASFKDDLVKLIYDKLDGDDTDIYSLADAIIDLVEKLIGEDEPVPSIPTHKLKKGQSIIEPLTRNRLRADIRQKLRS